MIIMDSCDDFDDKKRIKNKTDLNSTQTPYEDDMPSEISKGKIDNHIDGNKIGSSFQPNLISTTKLNKGVDDENNIEDDAELDSIVDDKPMSISNISSNNSKDIIKGDAEIDSFNTSGDPNIIEQLLSNEESTKFSTVENDKNDVPINNCSKVDRDSNEAFNNKPTLTSRISCESTYKSDSTVTGFKDINISRPNYEAMYSSKEECDVQNHTDNCLRNNSKPYPIQLYPNDQILSNNKLIPNGAIIDMKIKIEPDNDSEFISATKNIKSVDDELDNAICVTFKTELESSDSEFKQNRGPSSPNDTSTTETRGTVGSEEGGFSYEESNLTESVLRTDDTSDIEYMDCDSDDDDSDDDDSDDDDSDDDDSDNADFDCVGDDLDFDIEYFTQKNKAFLTNDIKSETENDNQISSFDSLMFLGKSVKKESDIQNMPVCNTNTSYTFYEDGNSMSNGKSQSLQNGKIKDPKSICLSLNTDIGYDPSRPHMCTICFKSFGTASHLKQHIIIVHDQHKPFQCSHCSTAFVSKSQLKVHTDSVHFQVRSYQCSICYKFFASTGDLKTHMDIVHYQLKPHQCSTCYKSFGYLSQLKQHIASVHRPRKPHQCTVCSRSFVSKFHLKAHIDMVHQQNKAYPCNYCEKSFNRTCDLKNHMKRSHNAELSSNVRPSHGVSPPKLTAEAMMPPPPPPPPTSKGSSLHNSTSMAISFATNPSLFFGSNNYDNV